MKKIGIIDYYISNFHTNGLLKVMKELKEENGCEEFVISHVYASLDKSVSTGETTEEWCKRSQAKKCDSIREVVDNADVIMVLAPNHPQLHEEMVKIPFESGKPIYVDKTFAPDNESAERIIAYGKKCGANYWSSSLLRFDSNISEYRKDDKRLDSLVVNGVNTFDIYCIHFIELINTIMKRGVQGVTCFNNDANIVFQLRFADGRKAFYNQYCYADSDFYLFAAKGEKSKIITLAQDGFKNFVKALFEFFKTGVSPVSIEDTYEGIKVRTAMIQAKSVIGKEVLV